MRHRIIGKSLSRTSAHKKAMLCNLSKELIKHETIKTTLAKAKELRRFIEPIITYSKIDTVSRRRHIFKKIRNKHLINKLFLVLGKNFNNRNGGYLRILKYKYRIGDNAILVLVTLVK